MSAGDAGRRLLEVGRVARVHGLRGEVVVALTTDRVERVAPGSRLETAAGTLVVASSRAHGDRWLVRFETVADRTAAEALCGVVLMAEALEDPDELWVHELVGCRVIDQLGIDRGSIHAVQANPAADLLVLESGALVPVVFVTEGPNDGVVRVEVPDGLFELTGPG